MRRLAGISSVALLCLGGACSDETLSVVQPRLVVTPETLDFGEGCIGGENIAPLSLRNRGEGRLEIREVRVTSDDGVFSARLDPTTVPPRTDLELEVRFDPRAPTVAYQGTLVIVSNDPDAPEYEVPLQGVGGIREIEVSPTEIDFGVVNEGLSPRRAIEIRNLGGDPLVVTGLVWTSTSVDLAPVDLPSLPLTVAAKTSTTIFMQYEPADIGGDAGTLRIDSNDEDEPMVEVEVKGVANLAPVAIAWICEKEPDVPGCAEGTRQRSISAGVGRIMGLEGRDSFDPEAGNLDFSWEVVAMPDGQRPRFFFGNQDVDKMTGEVEVTAVGRYELRLVVEDDLGLPSFDLPESRIVIRPKDLEVYLRWDLATDVDLHFVRPGGRAGDYGSGFAGTSTGSDCSAFNRNPNWGDPMSPFDDPSLERDVVSGRGPEIVSVDFPEAGTYTAYAHYCDSRHVNTNINAYLEIFVRGEAVMRVPVMDGQRMLPGELWSAAIIEWDPNDETAVVREGTAPIESRRDLCIIE